MWLFWSGGGSAADGKVPFCVFNMHFFPAVHFQAGNLLSFQTPISIISPAMTAFICSEMNAAKFPRNSRGPVVCPPPRAGARAPTSPLAPLQPQSVAVPGTRVCKPAHPMCVCVCAPRCVLSHLWCAHQCTVHTMHVNTSPCTHIPLPSTAPHLCTHTHSQCMHSPPQHPHGSLGTWCQSLWSRC